MESVNWRIKGMTCSNCALSISKYLEKEGMQNVKVNPIDGDVHFDTEQSNEGWESRLSKGIASLGYQVVDEKLQTSAKAEPMNKFLRFTLLCLPFTLLLMLHMIPALQHSWFMNPWIQLGLCLPVYLIGMNFFGRSAIKSMLNGMPNMNVLVSIGATAAFAYSLTGSLLGRGHEFLFYETTASIITLVFFGNYLEDLSISSTQKKLNQLVKSQTVMANMIAFDDHHHEHVFPVENTQLKSGDLVLIKNGELVPADAKVLSGDAMLNESIITGESVPVKKQSKDKLIGGSLLVDGLLRAQITASPKEGVLANIINLVKKAQGDKPPIQRMADRISAIFVPAVLAIAAISFVVNYFVLDSFTPALLRSIAVLVIACPCAMGLATPAAIAVGLGRAARSGVLFRNAKSLEAFKTIEQVVFDKTGTLTTGNFSIAGFSSFELPEEEFKTLLYSLEKFSNHPIAKSIGQAWKSRTEIRWTKIEELRGRGMKAIAKDGTVYEAGSFATTSEITVEAGHNIYVLRNGKCIGWVDVKDEIRPEAAEVIRYLHKKNIQTILLSGDSFEKANNTGKELQIGKVFAEKTPEEKLTIIEQLTAEKPTAMVGDGINDAPALAKATLGISLSDASQVAMQTADVVLMGHGIRNLPAALGLGRHTLVTIKQNLFWAFAYNIVAIPIAAFGLLTPTIGALVMGLSDVVLAINSARLYIKKVV